MKALNLILRPFKWVGGYVALVLAGLIAVLYYIVAVPVISVVQMFRFLFGKNFVRQIRDKMAGDRLYYSPNHLRIARDGQNVTAGPDELLLRLLGNVDKVTVPEMGSSISKGSPLFTLNFGDKDCQLASPVQGRVVEINSLILEHPEMLGTMNPAYLWMIRMKPENFAKDLPDMIPSNAFARLSEAFNSGLMDFFAPDNAVVRADGGMFIRGLARQLSKDEWDKLKLKLLLV